MRNQCTLTRDQRNKDYEYLWRVLNECYLMRGVMQRLGYNWDAIKEECKPAVLDAHDDLEFCRALNKVIERLDHFAHLLLFNANVYRRYQQMFQAFAEGAYEGMDMEVFAPWMESLHQPVSERFYAAFDDSENAGREFFWKDEPHENIDPKQRTGQPDPDVSCKMLPGDVAYLKIPTVDMLRIAGDRPILFEFYKQNKKCKDLIIDIRGNGGGATDYWNKLLVAPTLKGTVYETKYLLFAKGPLNERFIEASLKEKGEMHGEVHPIDELPAFPNFHQEYLSQATHYVKGDDIHEPDFDHPFEAQRKWLLTDRLIFSSAEGFAVFCRKCKWATIVGERTGGDGIGITPFHAVLPESGLLVRYSAMLGLNNDGGSNAEFHTVPDIECDPADALMVCLAKIAELDKAYE